MYCICELGVRGGGQKTPKIPPLCNEFIDNKPKTAATSLCCHSVAMATRRANTTEAAMQTLGSVVGGRGWR